jgi:hypothetical protein
VDEDTTQFEVFTDANASDPTHSMLSKDHFDNVLNEPAGKVAEVVVEHTVNLVVAAWSDPNVDIGWTLNEVCMIPGDESLRADSILQITQAFHHPFYVDSRSQVQRNMEMAIMKWFEDLRPNDASEILRRLTKV